MLFNSLTYLFFLVLVFSCYWVLPQKFRLLLILLASCVFYGFWRLEFLPLLLFSATLDYYLAIWIEQTSDQGRRRRLMIASVVVNLAILGFFKYLIFFKDAIWSGAQWMGYTPGAVELNIVLPLGISFYIFATISYVVDVYRREFPAERNFLTYVCFVVYFPHLVAGPILRARSLIPQLRQPAKLTFDLCAEGISRITSGLFLKVCLADPIGWLVDLDFQRDPTTLSALDVWTVSFLFGFQIYFDFAGYSHIAIGSSKLLGIHLPENFNFPYIATSPKDFWRRWHISLSTWIRDYVYLPISGSYISTGIARSTNAPEPGLPDMQGTRTLSLYATWAIMGFWHGANLTFVLWGVFHATIVRAFRVFGGVYQNNSQSSIVSILGWAVTLPLMMIAWIPFRSQSTGQAFSLWARLIDVKSYFGLTLLLDRYVTAAGVMAMILSAYFVHKYLRPQLSAKPFLLFGFRAIYYAVAFAFVMVFLQVRTQFIREMMLLNKTTLGAIC
jgi:alginate O-acetyltransferase complex protein AlgI